VNREFNVDAFLGEFVEEFADGMLRLGDGHAVAGHDHDRVGGFEKRGGFLWRNAAGGLLFAGHRGDLHLTKRAEEDVGEGPVHRLAHDDREDEPRRAIERAGNDEQFIVEHEPHRRRGETGVGIQ
jgi:hypothetical protein